MKTYLCGLILLLLYSANAFAVMPQIKPVGCTNLPGDVQLTDNGSLVSEATLSDGTHKIIPSSGTSGNTTTYKIDDSTRWQIKSYVYKLTQVNGKPTTLNVVDTYGSKIFAGPLTAETTYELGSSSTGKCFLKSIKDNGKGVIVYDSGLCEKLVQDFDQIAQSEIDKCTTILNQMSAAIKDYTSKANGYTVEPDASSFMQKSLMFASDCKKAIGLADSSNSTAAGAAGKTGAGAN